MMEKEFMFDDELFDELYDEELVNELEQQSSYSKNMDFYLTEIDFYPPSDNRVWTSNIGDIDGGDNFSDYCKYIFNMLEEEGYYDN